MEDALVHGLFKRAKVGSDGVVVSYLFYTRDAIFMGEWVTVLQCFYLVSGSKVNMHKSSLIGVSLSLSEVHDLAMVTGYGVTTTPFSYLGMLV